MKPSGCVDASPLDYQQLSLFSKIVTVRDKLAEQRLGRERIENGELKKRVESLEIPNSPFFYER